MESVRIFAFAKPNNTTAGNIKKSRVANKAIIPRFRLMDQRYVSANACFQLVEDVLDVIARHLHFTDKYFLQSER